MLNFYLKQCFVVLRIKLRSSWKTHSHWDVTVVAENFYDECMLDFSNAFYVSEMIIQFMDVCVCIICMWVCKYAAHVESRTCHQGFPLLPHDSLSWNWTLAFLANKLLGTVCFRLFLQVLGCSSGSHMCLLGIQT